MQFLENEICQITEGVWNDLLGMGVNRTSRRTGETAPPRKSTVPPASTYLWAAATSASVSRSVPSPRMRRSIPS